MNNLRNYVLYVAQCAVLEQSVMYHDIEHKNIHYCDGTNLKDRLQNNSNNSQQSTPVADFAVADLAVAY